MMNTGFIMLKREMLNWEWYTDVNTSKLFFHCLFKVNYSEKKWQGHTVKRGEFITSYEKLAIETGLTTSKVRTALRKLVDSGHLLKVTSNNFTRISITRLSEFVEEVSQSKNNKQNDTQFSKALTQGSQTNHKQIATTNNNKKNITTRKKIFREKVFSHSKFNSKDLNAFFNYWSELNNDKTKMHFEKYEFFEIEKRLERWTKSELKKGVLSKTNNELLTNR